MWLTDRPVLGGGRRIAVSTVKYAVQVESHRSLLSVLRAEPGRTGTREGRDDSGGDAYTVLLDGRPLNSRSYLALQAALGGDLCRRVGYRKIVRAVPRTASEL